jgi:hypothetical protein
MSGGWQNLYENARAAISAENEFLMPSNFLCLYA